MWKQANWIIIVMDFILDKFCLVHVVDCVG